MNKFSSKLLFKMSSLIILPLILTGCAPFMSSSLRVEVDVYKGPVSMEPEVQEAELDALILSLPSGLNTLDNGIKTSMCHLGCYADTAENIKKNKNIQNILKLKTDKWSNNREYYTNHKMLVHVNECIGLLNTFPDKKDAVSKLKKKTFRVDKTKEDWHNICPPMIDLRKSVSLLRKKAIDDFPKDKSIGAVSSNEKPNKEKIKLYAKATEYSGLLRIAATEIAFDIASVQNQDKRVRISQAKFANFTAEYSNQLSSRADTLIKIERGEKSELLPTSIYLRDAAPTAFLDLFEQYDASADGPNFNNARVRANITKKLFDDDNWGRVNEVYASGLGKVSMAFIKDDIGNWNLKSFENDPTEMIDAYKQVGVASLKAAQKVISGNMDVGKAIGLLGGASQAQTGNVSPSGSTSPLDLEPLRENMVTKIKAKKKFYVDKNDISIDDRKQAIREMRDLLEHHDYLIKALQTVTVNSIEKKAPVPK